MFCFNCGEKLPANAKFCTKCGTNLSSERSSAAEGSEIPPQIHTPANAQRPNNSKKMGIIAAAVLVPVIAVIAFFALRPGPESEVPLASAPNIPAYNTQEGQPEAPMLPVATPALAAGEELISLGSEYIGYLFQIPSAWSYEFKPARENYWQGSGFDIRTHNPVVSVATYLNTIHGPTIHDLFGYEQPWARHAAVSLFEFDDGRIGYRATNLRGGTITFATLNEATLEMAILRVYLWEDDIWENIPWDADIPDDAGIEWADLHWDLQWNDMYWWDGLDWFNENEELLDQVGRSLTPVRAERSQITSAPQDGVTEWKSVSDGWGILVEIPATWTYEIVDSGLDELFLINEDGSIRLFAGYMIAGDPQVFIDENDSQSFSFGDGNAGYMLETPDAIMWVPVMGGWISCCGISFYHGGDRTLFERNEDVLLRIARSLRVS